MMDIPTVKELIELEENSVRTLTVKEILRDKQLDELADVEKALSFAEGDATEVDREEEGKEEKAAAVELGEVEEAEETETS